MSDPGAPTRITSTTHWSNFTVRVVAALVLAPLALFIVWLGGWYWIAFAIAIGIGLFVEWIGITGARPLWLVAGVIYAAAPAIAAIVLRMDATHGLYALVFVLVIVWASDSFGYLVGRAIGGPKLWPRVSPKKTWAGAIGAVAGSAFAGGLFALAGYAAAPLALLGALMSVVAQAGDLLESAIKRRFGVKDSSQIIPGHGGLMDRLDAFIAVVVLAAIIGLVRGQGSGAAAGLMLW